MTKDELIEMATRAGFWNGLGVDGLDELSHFAKLVAEKEREACAKLCERLDLEGVTLGGEPAPAYGNDCAKAIRARGE